VINRVAHGAPAHRAKSPQLRPKISALTVAAGTTKGNEVASVTLPGLGVVQGVETANGTSHKNGVDTSYSTR
jgi:hypothetical protein